MSYAKSGRARRWSRIAIAFGFLASNTIAPALAGPSGGTIVSGSGTISQSGNNSTINQSTDRLIIEWDSFDTTANESVRFNQPNVSSSVLNRVLSGQATTFDGSLFANGNVIIVNGAGIHFGPSARVDVGSLIASTADISNRNFLDGKLIFDRPGLSDASISNAGTISARDSGLVALVAPGVENSGLIRANLGTVILGAGEAHTIDFNGDGLISFTITEPTKAAPKRKDGSTMHALVDNSGKVQADGGSVIMTARQASRVLDNAINMSGVAQANSVGVRNGKIVLFGGKKGRVNVSGKVRARGKQRGQRGGRVHIAGEKIAIPRAKIDVTGKAGGGEVLIGGAYQGGKLADDSTIGYLQAGDLVSILTGDGAGAAGNGWFPNAESVFVGSDAVIDVSATEAGDGGTAILWSDGKTGFNGSILARGGTESGNGGFVETSGKLGLGVGATASVDALAPSGLVGDWLLDPANVTIQSGGTATLAQIADTSDTTSNLVVDPAVISAATANVSIFATDTINFVDAVTTIFPGVGLTATADTIIIGNSITTAGAQTYDGAVELSADVALTSTGGGDITFDSTLDGTFDLTVNTAGTTRFNSDIGETTRLGSLTTDAAGTTAFSATAASNDIMNINIDDDSVFGDNVDLSGNNQTWNTFGTATFNGTFGGNVDMIMNPRDTLTFNGAVTLRGFQVANAGTVNINGGSVTMTTFAFRINNPVVLGADTTFNVSNMNLESRFTDPVDGAFSLTINSPGPVEFRDTVGATTPLTGLITDADGTLLLNGGTIALAGGAASFGEATTLGVDTTITGAGAITFGNTVDSQSGETNSLSVSGSGDVTFSGAVGSTDALSSLDVASGGAISFLGAVTTDNGDVSLAADDIALAAAVNAGTGIVTLDTFSASRQINLGGTVLGRLSFTDADLDLITANTIRIGGISSGDITIASAINPANATNLELTTAGAVIDNTPTEQSDLIANNVTINAGTGIGTATNDIDVASALLTLTNTTSGAVNVFNTGALTVTGDSVVSSFAAVGTIFNVDNAATVTSSGTLAVDALFGNLDGNLTASGGITGNLTSINVLGSTGGAEIQDAVDLAATGATINVAAGSYAAFTADVTNLSVIGVGESTIVNAASPAITITANGTSISNMLLQGTGAAGDVGILLDGTTTPNLTGITITNVDIDNMDDGIRSQGDIGDGVAANVDVAIAGNSATDPALFQDFLDAAIDVGDTDGDAVYTITDVTVQDGSDSNTVATQGPGFRIGSIGSARIQRVTMSNVGNGSNDDGIQFAAQTGATIDILDSSISARDDGIDFFGLNGGTVTIARNSLIRGTRNTFGDGIEFGPVTNGAIVNIVGNTEISGRGDAIEFGAGLNASTVTIAGNTTIQGDTSDAIVSTSSFVNSIVVIGSATVPVEGVSTSFGGNSIIGLGDDGFSLQGMTGGSLTIRDNPLISGNALTGTPFNKNGLDFINFALTDAAISITGNAIQADNHGIYINNDIAGSTTLEILNNTIGTSTNRVGEKGIYFAFGEVRDTSTVTIGGTNQVFAGEEAISVSDLISSNPFSITGGTYDGTLGALIVDNTGFASTGGSTGQIVIGAAAFVGGTTGNVVDILTQAGNNGLSVDFSGAATIDGGANGIRLSGPLTDVLNDTFGSIAIGSTTTPTTNFIQLANGAEFLPGSPTLLDARGVSFSGTLGNSLTAAQALALEDQLVHFPDDNTLGLINTNDLFVADGESIQTAVNAAGLLVGPQTVIVGPGTFGGSVEVWVDNLTLTGQGATTIIDTDAVDPFANNGDVNNGFDVVASSALSGGGTVTGVTIDGFAFDTVTTSGANTGIRLGGAATTRIAENTTIQNNTFNDVNEGIFRNNTIGTTTISGNTMTNIADRGIVFANRAIDGETIIVTDNAVTSVDRSLVFFPQVQNSDVTIQGNTFDSGSDALIFFFGSTNSTILVGGDTAAEANDIVGTNRGIFTFSLDGGSFTVANNTRIASGATMFGSGIEFTGVIQNGANVEVLGNSLIEGNFSGLLVVAPILSSTMTVAGNTQINGVNSDGISFIRDITDSNVTIGPATATVDGTVQTFGGNTITGGLTGIAHFAGTAIDGTSVVTYAGNDITGGDDGIFFDAIEGNAQINVTDNTSITGQNFEGIYFFEDVAENAVVTIARNTINGGDDGVEFEERVLDDVTLTFTDNTITGATDGVEFSEEIDDNANVTFTGNTVTGTTEEGLEVNGLFNNTTMTVTDNTFIGGQNGIAHEVGITGAATTTIVGNTITGTTVDGIGVTGLSDDTSMTVTDNTITGGQNGIGHNAGITGTATTTIMGNTITGTTVAGIGVTGLSDNVV
ncbi:MAG: filamentous hemagglutinin N-terminal domain-containing protein [Pseudomonadota bacterium]